MLRPGEIEIAFKKAPGGPPIFDPASQRESKEIRGSLEAAGVAFSYPEREMAFDSAEDILEIVVASGVAFRAMRPIIIAYLSGRAGQKIAVSFYESGRIKHIVAPTTEDVDCVAGILDASPTLHSSESQKKGSAKK